MKMKNKYNQLFGIFLMLIVFAGCKKFVQIPPPDNQLVSGNAFSDDGTADATMAGVYTRMNDFNYQFGNVLGSFMPAFAADEFYYAFSTAAFDEFKNDALTPDNTYVNSMWESAYSFIYQANAVIEGINNSNTLSQKKIEQLDGEAKFVRAFCYFFLVNRFGDIPLILNTDFKVNTSLPRTDKDEVYKSIIDDLTDAEDQLSSDYISSEKIRPNKAAATALLARTYLYLENWPKASEEATKVIESNQYKILDDLNEVFLKNSDEAIWQLQSVNKSTAGVNTWEGFNIVPVSSTARSYYNLYDQLVEAFEPGDKRLEDWTGTYVLNDETFHFPYKYKVRTASPVQEYGMVIRFAELYLIRAEADAHLGNLDEAKNDLDTIRNRANLSFLEEGLTKDQMLDKVAQERRVELFGEWGHRWFDLIRTGKALEELGAMKPGLKTTDLLYPIPRKVMLTNPNMIPNDGYN